MYQMTEMFTVFDLEDFNIALPRTGWLGSTMSGMQLLKTKATA